MDNKTIEDSIHLARRFGLLQKCLAILQPHFPLLSPVRRIVDYFHDVDVLNSEPSLLREVVAGEFIDSCVYVVSVGEYEDNTIIGVTRFADRAREIAQQFSDANYAYGLKEGYLDSDDPKPVLEWPKWSDIPQGDSAEAEGQIWNIDNLPNQAYSNGRRVYYYVHVFKES